MNDTPEPSDHTQADRLRDLIDGRLAPADAEALRREIETDAALRADFERMRDVLAMTAAEPAMGGSTLTADALIAASGGRIVPARRWWMAAAVVVAAAWIGAYAMTRPPEVTLKALAVPSVDFVGEVCGQVIDDSATGPPPAGLADFRPVANGRQNWLRSFDEAQEIARETGRPMLVWITHAQCPMCIQLDRETFSDAAVQADVEAFVPVKVDVMKLDQDSELGRTFRPAFQNGEWPYMVVLRPDGTEVTKLTGVWRLPDVKPKLDEAARNAGPNACGTWEQIGTAAADLARAEDAKRDGRLGDALAAAQRAADMLPDHCPARIVTRARQFARTLDPQPWRVLADAARADDPSSAVPSLDAAARAYAGSPEGDDLAAVAQAIRESGKFPRLRDRTETHR